MEFFVGVPALLQFASLSPLIQPSRKTLFVRKSMTFSYKYYIYILRLTDLIILAHLISLSDYIRMLQVTQLQHMSRISNLHVAKGGGTEIKLLFEAL